MPSTNKRGGLPPGGGAEWNEAASGGLGKGERVAKRTSILMPRSDGATANAALLTLVDAAGEDVPPTITALAETLQHRLDEREAAHGDRQSVPAG